jgi:hypothetical protein
MQFTPDERGLTITIDAEEQAELKKLMVEHEYPDSDDFLIEYMGGPLSNSEYGWCDPSEIGALTSAPILCTRDEAGDVIEAYGFMAYQVISLQEQLVRTGSAWLQRG